MKKLMLLIMSLLALSMAFAAIQQPDTKPLAEDCGYVSSIGLASNSNPAVLDPDKIVAVLSSGENSYYCLKNILGLWDYNFYITITNPTGTNFIAVYSENWGKNYTGIFGVFPGNNVLVSNVDHAFADSLSVSPSYQPPSGGMVPYFIWDSGETILSQPYENVQESIMLDASNFGNFRTFKRIVVIDNGEKGYETALLTLGVWY